jgi:hypothetical protein
MNHNTYFIITLTEPSMYQTVTNDIDDVETSNLNEALILVGRLIERLHKLEDYNGKRIYVKEYATSDVKNYNLFFDSYLIC